MRQLRHLRRSERGQSSLVELLVAMVMASILAFGIFYLLVAFMSSYFQILNQHIMDDEQSDLNAYVFEAGYNLGTADLAPNYLNPASVSVVALSGDQLTWCYNLSNNDQRWCTRYFYVARWREVFKISAPEVSLPAIAPVRGPNQTVPAWVSCTAPCYVAPPGSPLHDQVLDGIYQGLGGANEIALNVSLGEANVVSADITNDNAPFKFYTPLGDQLTFMPAEASSSSAPITPAQRATIAYIDFDFYLQPLSDAPWAKVPPLHYQYRLTVAAGLLP